MNQGFISKVRVKKKKKNTFESLQTNNTGNTGVHITIAFTSKQGFAAGTGTARAPVAQCVCVCVFVCMCVRL